MAEQKIFREDELASDADVEKLETQEQQQPVQPEQQPTEKEAAPAKEEGKLYDGTGAEKSVPFFRLQELNDAKVALEKELAEHREFRARLDERQRIIREANEQQQRQAEQQRIVADRPNPELDPIGAQLYDMQLERFRDRQEIEQLKGQLNQFGQNYQQSQEQTQFTDWIKSEANAYQAVEPSYFNSAKHAADRRIAFWKEVAPNAPAGTAERMVEAESMLIARLAQQYGGKFAPALHKLARDWGFNPAAVNGHSNVVPLRQPQNNRLQQVQAGQRVQGLGAVPAGNGNEAGTSAYRNYSPADIANMSEREFMTAMSNPASARDLKYALARADGLEGEGNY